MSSHFYFAGASLTLLALGLSTSAAPKPTVHQTTKRPHSAHLRAGSVLIPQSRSFLYKPTKSAHSLMPNMTQMPNSRIISAFDLTVPGRRLLTDVSGQVIGQSSPAATNGVVWFDGRPAQPAPHFVPKVAVPKPKR